MHELFLDLYVNTAISFDGMLYVVCLNFLTILYNSWHIIVITVLITNIDTILDQILLISASIYAVQ